MGQVVCTAITNSVVTTATFKWLSRSGKKSLTNIQQRPLKALINIAVSMLLHNQINLRKFVHHDNV